MLLCIGTTPTAQRSMTFPHLVLDHVNRSLVVSEYASGKSINVARVLASLGHSPLCTGFLGGPRGVFIRHDLTASSIPHDFVETSTPTRLCTTLIDSVNHTATELVEESSPVTEADWNALDARILHHLPQSQICILSGSLPPDSDPSAYARWTQTALAHNVRVILDARGESVRRTLPLGRFTLKLNREELAATLDTPLALESDLTHAVNRALPEGGALVVTLGKHGSIATDGRHRFRIHTPPIHPISAVGSGDSFAAGLAAGYADNLSFPDACRLAAACGTANALTDRAGYLDLHTVEALFSQTTIHSL